MKIGVVPALNPGAGGMYQYSITMLHQLSRLENQDGSIDDLLILTSGERFDAPALNFISTWESEPLDPPTTKGLAYRGVKRLVPPGGFRDLLARRVGRYRVGSGSLGQERSATRRWLEKLGVNRMVFCTPDPRSFEIALPYMMPIHDLQHRLQPQFPEVVEGGELERREYLYTNAARTARVLLVDSDVGRDDLIELYAKEGLTEDRVIVLPFLPPPMLQTANQDEATTQRLNKRVPHDFLFYPAQFWPHKNHARLIAALGQLRRDGLVIPLVLCGSSSGPLRTKTYREVMELAESLGVADQIHSLGYVSDEVLASLYRSARALVFPTFFGPTNIPIVEAWLYDCPVLTSDIRGIREQAGEAALLASPHSADALAAGIQKIWSDEDVRTRLVEQGRKMLNRYTPDDYNARLRTALGLLMERS